MNQEEWLEYRRSLGLPADPEKDFPPGFRNDPKVSRDSDVAHNPTMTERQRRKSAAAEDAARRASRNQRGPGPGAATGPTPGPAPTTRQGNRRIRSIADALDALHESGEATPSPPPPGAPNRPSYGGKPAPGPQGPPKKSNNPVGCCLLVIVIIIAMFSTVLLPLGKDIVSLFTESSSSSSSSTYKSYTERRKAEEAESSKRVQAQSKEFMELFIKGDPDAVAVIKSNGGATYDSRLLTPEQAKSTMGADAKWTQTGVSVVGSMGTVEGNILTSSGRIPVKLRLLQNDDVWSPSGLRIPVLRGGNGGLPSGTKVNGTKLTVGSTEAYTGFLVWPGTTTVELPTGGSVTYAEPEQKFEATEELIHLGAGQPLRVDVSPK